MINFFLKMTDGKKLDLSTVTGGGQKLEDINKSHKSIFQALDANKNNVLDEAEIKSFIEKVMSFAVKHNKENLGDKEFEALKASLGDKFKELTKDELLNFIKFLSENASGVKLINKNPNGEMEYLYEDGSRVMVYEDITEFIDKDGNSYTKDKDGNIINRTNKSGSTTITEEKLDNGGVRTTVYDERTKSTNIEIKDKDGKLVSESFIDEMGVETKKTYLDNGVKEISTHQNGAETSVRYENEDGVPCDIYGNPLEAETPKPEEKPKTTRVVVQNGEIIAALAKKFGCSAEEIIKANPGLVKGKAPNQYFYAGEEITIPREISAEALEGRQTKEEVAAAYTAMQSIRDEVRARKPITWTERNYNTFEEIARQLFKREGIENPTKEQLEERVADLKKTNPGLKDGELKGKKIVANVDEGMYNRVKSRNDKAEAYNNETAKRKEAEALAKEFYNIADHNSGNNSMRKMQAFFDEKVNADNIVALLDAYDKAKNGDSSIIDTVTSEKILSGDRSAQKRVLRTIMAKLIEAARKAGVSEGDIKKANDDFEASIKKEYDSWSGAFRPTNPLEMEKAIDFLRGAIVAKQTENVKEMSDAEAMGSFNEDFAATDAEAQQAYKEAREEEGWIASVGDTICGWFGCTTMEDMEKKLGKNAEAVKRLAAAKTEAEFKAIYKEIFGIEFDKNKIAARDAAYSNYCEAQQLNAVISIINDILKNAEGMGYEELRNTIKEKFQWDDETIDKTIAAYAESLDIPADSEEAKQTLLLQFLRDTQTNSAEAYNEITKGKSLEQMAADLELLNKSAFGTNDIVKDVIQFNQNMVITEMVTQGAFEIAGTIALQFVPGLGQIAAARLAASAAKWGTKAVKLTKTLKKAEKVFEKVNKFEKGEAYTSKVANKGAQIGSQMVNAGAATAAVDLSNGDEVKEALKKALMNMSFAGVGASSSVLAPRLMKALGIDKTLATEIAEEIINAAGTYGVTKISGDDYGSSEAFIDFVTGLVMSRVSHVKHGEVKHGEVKPGDSTGSRTDGAGDSRSNATDNSDTSNHADGTGDSKINAESVRQKYGEYIHNLYKKAEDLIQKLKTLADYEKAKTYIKTQFGKIDELMDNLLDKLEAAAKKIGLKTKEAVHGKTRSKYFKIGDVSDFINTPIYNPQKLYKMMLNQGFEPTPATYFKGKEAFISMYDPRSQYLHTYIFDKSGNCIEKSVTKVTRNADGSFTRHSDLTVTYNKDGKAHASITEDNQVIYEDDFTIAEPRAKGSAGSNAGGADNSSRSNGADSEFARKRAEAYSKFNRNAQSENLPPNGSTLDQNAQYGLDLNNMPILRLVDGTTIDLNTPEIRNKIASLKEGEFLTIGRDGDIKINAGDNVSRHHILITRHNGQIVMKDISANGNTSCWTPNNAHGTSGSGNHAGGADNSSRSNGADSEFARKRAEAYSKFNRNAQSENLPPNGSTLDQNAQYGLDLNNMPILRLVDGTTIDLNTPEIRNKIASLKEGEFLTIGRDGDIKINAGDNVSRHHILITRHNGQIVMKDISANGNTSCWTPNNARGASGSSNHANGAGAASGARGTRSAEAQRIINEAHQKIQTLFNKRTQLLKAKEDAERQMKRISLSKEKYIEYKKLLGIPANEPLTAENLKKAFRRKSIEYHPDRHPDKPEFTEKFQEINSANDALKKYLENSAERSKLQAKIKAYDDDIAKIDEEIRKQQQIIRNAQGAM